MPVYNKSAHSNVPIEGRLKLKKTVELFSGIAIIVGTMIGSGIFISPKGVIAASGSVAAGLLIWAACGAHSLMGSLCYAELGTSIPKSGGTYAYLLEGLGPIPAFLYAWTTLILTSPSSGAVVCLTFATYLLDPLFGDCGPPKNIIKLLASAAVLTIGIVNCLSVKTAVRLQVLFTAAKLTALLVIIAGGAVQLTFGKTQYLLEGFEGSTSSPALIVFAFYQGLFAYGGWDNLNNVTEEIKNPYRNLPRAILIAVPLVTVIYIMTNISYFTVLSKDTLLASDAVAVSWGHRVLGGFSLIIPISVACSTFGAANGGIFARTRMCYVAARDGHWPEILSYINVRHYTPIPALIFSVILSLALISLGTITTLINAIGFSGALFRGLVMISMLLLRYRRKDLSRPFKVPLLIPVYVLFGSAYLIVAPIMQQPRLEIIYAAIFILSGLLLYIPFIHFKLVPPFSGTLIMWSQMLLETSPGMYNEPDVNANIDS